MQGKIITLTAVLIVLQFCGGLCAQPTVFTHNVESLAPVEPIITEPIDLQAVLMEDYQRNSRGGPYRFAINRPVKITPESDGVWEEIDDETLIWRLPIASPGAVSLSLGFTSYFMPAGGKLFIYSADETQILGPFTESDNEVHGQLWTPLIYSEAIVVELTIPSSELPQLKLELTSINHGYRNINPKLPFRALGDSDWCHRNVACSEGDAWRDQIRTVAMYQITLDDGTFLCTGTLINNTEQNNKLYFLTAFHCLDEWLDRVLDDPDGAAASMVIYWNFQASTCTGTTGSMNLNQSGAIFRAAHWMSDFALVELEDVPPAAANIYYAGWDHSNTTPSSGVAIHHPVGDLKKISIENDPLTQVSLVDYNPYIEYGKYFKVSGWDIGVTAEGSSGCPIFNSNKSIVGVFSNGASECSNPGPDYFGPLYRAWTGGGTPETRLSDWLDPDNSGVTFLDGKNPGDYSDLMEYASSDVPKDILDNRTITSTLVIAETGRIADLDVKLDITHTFDGDLDVYLKPPSVPPVLTPEVPTPPRPTPFPLTPSSVKLFSSVGGGGDNFHATILDDEASQSITQGSAPFDGVYKPQETLSSLYGENITGTWTLEVTDHSGGDIGKLNSWSLIIEKDPCPVIVSTFPYSESFESGLGYWVNSASDDIDWERHSGLTDSDNTGPSLAHNGTYYLYMEASDLGSHVGFPNKTAILDGPCFNIPEPQSPPPGSLTRGTHWFVFTFWYHMHGSAMGTLTVEASEDNGSSWTQLWSVSGNQDDLWADVEIGLWAYHGKTIKLRFKGITGSDYTSDIAIDDISIFEKFSLLGPSR